MSRWGQKKEIKTADDLKDHISLTYVYLRWSLVVIGFLLPVLLVVVGYFFRLPDQEPFQGSMSAYYRTPMRDVFVGGLWAIGSCLLLYKGYNQEEDWGLNVAGVSAIIVALFPLDFPSGGYVIGGWVLNPHGLAAVLFFVCCAIVALWQADKTLDVEFTNPNDPNQDAWRERLRRTYKLLGVLLIAGPVGIWIAVQVTNITLFESGWLLVAESVAFWVFASYWAVKSIEIDFLTRVEKKAITGQVKPQEDGKIVSATTISVTEANNSSVTEAGSQLTASPQPK
jgi:hypothetical protein